MGLLKWNSGHNMPKSTIFAKFTLKGPHLMVGSTWVAALLLAVYYVVSGVLLGGVVIGRQTCVLLWPEVLKL